MYALRDSWLDADAIDVRVLLSLVAKQFPPSPDAHLLLITPYRDEPELRTDRDYRGTGRVAGRERLLAEGAAVTSDGRLP